LKPNYIEVNHFIVELEIAKIKISEKKKKNSTFDFFSF